MKYTITTRVPLESIESIVLAIREDKNAYEKDVEALDEIFKSGLSNIDPASDGKVDYDSQTMAMRMTMQQFMFLAQLYNIGMGALVWAVHNPSEPEMGE